MMYSSSKATVVAAAAKEGATVDHLVRRGTEQRNAPPFVANGSGVYDLIGKSFKCMMLSLDPGLLEAEELLILSSF